MSEITGGIPQPSSQPSGIAPAPGQPQPNTPAAPAATPSQPANPQAPAPAAPAAPAQPDALTQLQVRVEQAERAARHHQSRADQQAAQLRALTGVQQPQADPLEAKAETYAKQFGIAKDDALVMLRMTQAEMAPLSQRNQQLEAMVQGNSRVQSVYQAALEKDPQLFADPRIQQAVFNNLNDLASQGQLQYLDPTYALEYGAGEWARLNRPWDAASTARPAPPAPLPNYRPVGSFGGPPAGHAPLAPQTQPSNPLVDAMAAKMAKHAGVTLA